MSCTYTLLAGSGFDPAFPPIPHLPPACTLQAATGPRIGCVLPLSSNMSAGAISQREAFAGFFLFFLLFFTVLPVCNVVWVRICQNASTAIEFLCEDVNVYMIQDCSVGLELARGFCLPVGMIRDEMK
jgi:hypothetical protein